MKKHIKIKRLVLMIIVTLFFFNTKEALASTSSGTVVIENNKVQKLEVPDVAPPTSYTEVYERIKSWEQKIPTGTLWDDENPYGKNGFSKDGYKWKGGKIAGKNMICHGCTAFATSSSDALFGNMPATTKYRGSYKAEDIRIGDILCFGVHTVIVVETSPSGIMVAEGNNSGKVFWWRSMRLEDAENAEYMVTRYPSDFVSSDAEDAGVIVDQGKEGSLTWNLTKNGIMTISGKGAMPNFSLNDGYLPSWSKTEYHVNKVIIQSGITTIGDYAFYQSTAISVDIPDTVTNIGDSAFWKSNLIGIRIPGSVKTIGNQAFRDCTNLASVTFEEGTTTIGNNCFRACTNLCGIINIPGSITSIGDNAFLSCAEIMSVQFDQTSNNAVTIGDYAFMQCWKMLSIKLPRNLTCISNGMFQSCQMLAYLYIPASVEEVKLGMVDRDSPFVSMPLAKIDYESDQSKWESIGGQKALSNAYLSNVNVCFNVPPTKIPESEEKPVDPVVPPVDPDNPSGDNGNTGETENPDNKDDTGNEGNNGSSGSGENNGSSSSGENNGSSGSGENNGSSGSGENNGSSSSGENNGNNSSTGNNGNSSSTGNNSNNSSDENNESNGSTGNNGSSNKKKPKKYKYAKKVKGNALFDSENKKVSKYKLNKKGKMTFTSYKCKKKKKEKTVKNVVEVGYNPLNGNLVYRLKDGTVGDIDWKTLKTRTLYKNMKKLVRKNKFVVGAKNKKNKIKKLKK